MCGIIGYTGRSQALPVLIGGLENLEYRGYDSAGIALNEKEKISVIKSEGKLENLIRKIANTDTFSTAGIGHTRWATHGKPDEVNAHPHTSSDGKFCVVHNGIIENATLIKTELEKKGYSFVSETDTEVIPQLLSYHYRGDVLEAMHRTFSSLDGSFAVAVMCQDEPGTVYAAKRQSPMIVGKSKDGNILASDISALSDKTETFAYLEDDEFAIVKKDSAEFFDFRLNHIIKIFQKINTVDHEKSKENYEHYMLKEIFEQPEKIRNLIRNKIRNKKVFLDEIAELFLEISRMKKLYIVACGSAYNAALAGKYAIEEFCRIPVETDIASEFRYRNPPVDEDTVVVVISQSGETADTISAMRLANSKGAFVIGIVNVLPSTIANECDYVIATKAGREVAVATTKGYTSQVVALYMLALHMADVRKTLSDKTLEFYAEELMKIPEQISEVLSSCGNIEKIAEKYTDKNNVFFIGRNTDFASASEGALKLKEISYINCTSLPAGELKHGTIALIENGSPVVSLCANERLYKKTLSNIEEVVSRGAEVLLVCKETKHHSRNYSQIIIPECIDIFSPVCQVTALQLFAYFTAKKKGCNIDMPKNLAKSVTVE